VPDEPLRNVGVDHYDDLGGGQDPREGDHPYRAKTREEAERRLYQWLVHCADSNLPELHRLARTIDNWREELLAYFDTAGISNGPTEAMNLLIKKVKRTGHGFRNFDNYRLRLLLHCGVDWQTSTPTRVRGRLPRLIA
jgi:hypothetical protein